MNSAPERAALVEAMDKINEASNAFELLFMAAAGVGGHEREALRIAVAAGQNALERARDSLRSFQGGAA